MLGIISEATPTVYSILQRHFELADKWENIFFPGKNRNLPYTKLSGGCKVYFDQQSGALSLDNSGSDKAVANDTAPPASSSAQNSSGLKSGVPNDNGSQSEVAASSRLSLGRISEENPTVSHLLLGHPEIRYNAWEILGYAINKDKPFRQIPYDTEIGVNRATGEITWTSQSAFPAPQVKAPDTSLVS